MAQITVEMIRALRERTGAGMMDVKRALEQAGGDEEQAVRILREKGLAQVAKRASRRALEGLVEAHLAPDRSRGALVELNCETDFVAKTEPFRQLAQALARLAAQVAADGSDGRDPRGEGSLGRVRALLEHPLAELGGQPAEAAVSELAARVGENVRLRRFVAWQGRAGSLETYVHGEGRIGVLLQAGVEPAAAAERPEVRAVLRELAMQVAAFRPEYVERSGVPAEVLERERAIYRQAALNEGKPEKVVDRIVAGRLEKFFQEVCLLEQPFMREPDVTVARYVARASEPLGVQVRVVRFARFERAEQLAGEAAAGEE